jgi:catechol 2,3-dioxygenase-like lactoylglutathione lyase family enzyme
VSLHHHGLRVSDAERASAFYCDALGGRRLTLPVVLSGRGAEQVVGVEGARLRVALIGFGDGALEVFEFLEPAIPDWARAPVAGSIPHVGLQVDDVGSALARAEDLGARRLWPDVDRFGKVRAIYLADPDGNVVELLDGPITAVAAAFLKYFPDADPGADK